MRAAPPFSRPGRSWLYSGLCAAGFPFLALGCAGPDPWTQDSIPQESVQFAPVEATAEPTTSPTSQPGQEEDASLARRVSGADTSPTSQPGQEEDAPLAPASRPLPITLDAVLRLAEDHNMQIALAREKLHDSLLQSEIASRSWLPKTYAGIAYYRHEGGIQLQEGPLIHSSTGALFPGLELHSELDLREATFERVKAERQVWQEKGELRKVTSETLLEAAATYIDLLTARRGEAVARELGELESKLLERARKAIESDPSARAVVESIQATITGREQLLARLRQQGDAASAKLAHLLHVGPGFELVPVDPMVAPIELVAVPPHAEGLVIQAINNGPGVHELQGLLAAIHRGIEEAEHNRFLPTFEVYLGEGAFAAGPGGTLDLDNRLDLGLQVRWDLTALASGERQRRLAQSKLHQAHLRLEDLRGKLVAGVREAHSAIVSGRKQITWGSEQIRHAAEAYRISNLRLQEFARGSSMLEVQQTIRALDLAHFGYLQAVSEHNKAQVRLLLLLGPGPHHPHVSPPAFTAPSVEEATPERLPPPGSEEKKPTEGALPDPPTDVPSQG
jgi:outer membrane protein TolC